MAIPAKVYPEMEMDGQAVDVVRETDFAQEELCVHCHEHVEVFVCLAGEAHYRIGPERFDVQAGDFVMILPGVSHQMLSMSASQTPFCRIRIRLSADMTQLLEASEAVSLDKVMAHRPYHFVRTAGSRWAHLAPFCQSICFEAERGQIGWMGIVCGHVLTLMGLLERATYEESPLAREQQDLLERILRYVEENLEHKITLSDTARRFLVSESCVSKLFRKRMDVSFYRYVMKRRLMSAQRLIAQGTPLEQIYSQVGFCDHAAFYRAFRHEYGVSPQQYRMGCAVTRGRLPEKE